jgi:hypothetical protein
MIEDHDLVDLDQPVGLVGYAQDRSVLGSVQQVRGDRPAAVRVQVAGQF